MLIAEKAFGQESTEVAVRLNFLSIILEQSRRFAEAEPLLRRALTLALKDKETNLAKGMVNEIGGRYAAVLEAMGQRRDEIETRLKAIRWESR